MPRASKGVASAKNMIRPAFSPTSHHRLLSRCYIPLNTFHLHHTKPCWTALPLDAGRKQTSSTMATEEKIVAASAKHPKPESAFTYGTAGVSGPCELNLSNILPNRAFLVSDESVCEQGPSSVPLVECSSDTISIRRPLSGG